LSGLAQRRAQREAVTYFFYYYLNLNIYRERERNEMKIRKWLAGSGSAVQWWQADIGSSILARENPAGICIATIIDVSSNNFLRDLSISIIYSLFIINNNRDLITTLFFLTSILHIYNYFIFEKSIND
jgi:hypothetical protein